jgi:acetoacetyl-CoA synthetase
MGRSERGELLWTPSGEAVAGATITRYLSWLESERGLSFGRDYQALWRWSVDELEDFWATIWDFCGVRASQRYSQVLPERTMPGASWFPGARLNYAENLFAGKPGDRVAILSASELRTLSSLTWDELGDQVAAFPGGLRELGVREGDRVAAYMPNLPETVVALLATASLGAVWSSCSPDFGARGVVDRFAQIEPKVLLAVDGYTYGGRPFDRRQVVAEVVAELPTVEHAVVVPYLSPHTGLGGLRGEMSWDEVCAKGAGQPLSFAQVAYDHPLWVLYSSGTTGVPKAIVQGHGGILLEHLKKLHLHTDAKAGDRMFWFSTTGWMMWNFLIGALLTDAAIVCYDGSPGYPDMDTLWRLADKTGITIFGTSASYIAACMQAGTKPADGRDLSGLRAVGSTGSPLSPEGFQWIYDELGSDTWLFSTSGGTDLCTSFVGAVPVLTVYRGELQARSLGAKVESWDDEGRPAVGEVGELVITEPMPSMPLFFWADEDRSRYRESYFEHYPGVWRHGDWIEITPRGTAVIYGRSDSTINRSGVRMGTSEIYRAVATLPEVADALVVDLPRPGTEGWMPLFVVLAENATLTPELEAEIKRRIREHCSPRHVPDEIFSIAAVPRTLSGKVLEIPVKRILMGVPAERAASRGSLANPESLDFFSELSRRLAGEPAAARD